MTRTADERAATPADPPLSPSPSPAPAAPSPAAGSGRWSSAWRLVAAGLFGALSSLLVVVEAGDASPSPEQAGAWTLDVAVGLACLVLVAWRRRYPLFVVSVIGLAGAVSQFSGGPWLLAAVSIATRRRWSDVVVVAATSVAGALGYEYLHPSGDPAAVWFTPVLGTVIVIAATAFGWYVGARRELVTSLRERAETAERERAASLARARVAERAAIAREMHDVLAHRISLVAMHAGALNFRTDLDEAARGRIAQTVEENAQLALADLRDVLGVLRDPNAVFAAPDRPQPTLADVSDLVAATREAGTPVDFAADLPDDPPTTLGRHAYRIAQESLTNARKHAPGLPVTLRVRGVPGQELVVETVNPVPLRPARPMTGAGAGLAGMAERAALAGGTLEHGPTPEGRFRVLARLPWAAPTRQETP